MGNLGNMPCFCWNYLISLPLLTHLGPKMTASLRVERFVTYNIVLFNFKELAYFFIFFTTAKSKDLPESSQFVIHFIDIVGWATLNTDLSEQSENFLVNAWLKKKKKGKNWIKIMFETENYKWQCDQTNI